MKIEIGERERTGSYSKYVEWGTIRVGIKGKTYTIRYEISDVDDVEFSEYEHEVEFDLPDELKKNEAEQEEIEEFLTEYFEKEVR